ncbi:MAG: hypothetical protein GDA48_16700 [Hormoscilla sp. GM102CHS1]|nr:hypothetical protein [Hormoscilla sp. GM102CHS1]
MGSVSDRIENHVHEYLEIPQLINQINLDAIKQGYLNLDSPIERSRRTQHYFWQQIVQFDLVSYIYYSNEQKEFIGAGREVVDTGLSVAISGKSTNYTQYSYATDKEGNLQKLMFGSLTITPPKTFGTKAQLRRAKLPGLLSMVGKMRKVLA